MHYHLYLAGGHVMAQLVPTVRTSYTKFEIIKGFIQGWQKQFGTMPRKKSIAVLWSQNALETGSTTSMWNNNIGNVKYIQNTNVLENENIQYMMLSNVWEILEGKKVIFQPPHKATWFRSFPTLADGVSFHLDFLKNKRYKKAWVAVEAGSPIDFAHLLKLSNYYTASEIDYAKALASYFNNFMKDDTFEKVMESLVIAEKESVLTVEKEIPAVVVHATDESKNDQIQTTDNSGCNILQKLLGGIPWIFKKKTE